jgi:hypothetical protein
MKKSMTIASVAKIEDLSTAYERKQGINMWLDSGFCRVADPDVWGNLLLYILSGQFIYCKFAAALWSFEDLHSDTSL